MKVYFLSVVFSIFCCFSCQRSIESRTSLEQSVIGFGESFYNLNYVEAQEWATKDDLPYLQFMASNIHEEHLAKLDSVGPSAITILSSQVHNSGTEAKVFCRINHVLKIDYISGKSILLEQIEDTLHLIKDGAKWFVRMDNPLQSEMRNHD